jgi:uncharacterized protein (DUF1330 family)
MAARRRENGETMPYQMTVGLAVADDACYSQYREEIAPLLEAAGARFCYDFRIGQTLKSEAGHEINRLFMLQFPDRGARKRFFTDPQYIAIRSRLFERAVAAATVLAEYELAGS